MDQKQLDELKTLAEKAALPALSFDVNNVGIESAYIYGLVGDGETCPGINVTCLRPYHNSEHSRDVMQARAEFVAAACNLAPALVAEVERLTKQLAEANETAGQDDALIEMLYAEYMRHLPENMHVFDMLVDAVRAHRARVEVGR
jgi:hypothetical protein